MKTQEHFFNKQTLLEVRKHLLNKQELLEVRKHLKGFIPSNEQTREKVFGSRRENRSSYRNYKPPRHGGRATPPYKKEGIYLQITRDKPQILKIKTTTPEEKYRRENR